MMRPPAHRLDPDRGRPAWRRMHKCPDYHRTTPGLRAIERKHQPFVPTNVWLRCDTPKKDPFWNGRQHRDGGSADDQEPPVRRQSGIHFPALPRMLQIPVGWDGRTEIGQIRAGIVPSKERIANWPARSDSACGYLRVTTQVVCAVFLPEAGMAHARVRRV